MKKRCREFIERPPSSIPGAVARAPATITYQAMPPTAFPWPGEGDISELVRGLVRLRFHLQNARLYSFRISPLV